ncbi:hypothetical protein OB947_04835 [Aeromonas bestiarum]|uniref:hypothetical protein n=1 Tax=Aeromonas bestiarum TaxID=105751 RepID=UPI00259F1BE9|nr:hypothetical protein [Aeromonas bestiarum]MDM5088243.1 hypothetical protein [Aeromonas bestiarum]
MNHIRIIFFGTILFGSAFFGWDSIERAFGAQSDVYVIYGILNYWAIFSAFLSSLIIIAYCLGEILKRNISSSFLNRGAIISCVIVAPLLAFALKEITFQRASGYVECDKLHKLSSRFSSKTYAIDNNMCMMLEDNKKAP